MAWVRETRRPYSRNLFQNEFGFRSAHLHARPLILNPLTLNQRNANANGLSCVPAAVGAHARTLSAAAPAPSTANMLTMGAKDAIAALCSGQMTAVSYAKALLAKADSVRCLNAIQTINATQVRATRAA